jgi:hypothetical protein
VKPSNRTSTARGWAGAVVLAATLVGGLVPAPATATDLASLRARAQLIADQVSLRERDLARLEDKQATLASRIEDASRQLGVEELELRRAEEAAAAATDAYVERAVEAYMGGSATDLALLLSARDLHQLLSLAEATVASAQQDAAAVSEAMAAKEAAALRQRLIDERKQDLLRAQVRVDALQVSMKNALASRRQLLAQLTDQVADLELRAREAAAAAARPDEAFLDLLGGSGPSLAIPDGYAGTGVTFEGLASWYGPGFEGNLTASGDVFDSSLYTAASKELPLGTWLFVQRGGRGVVVLVNDRGPYVGDRILDLSRAAAEAIGLTGPGVGWVEAEILVKR